MWRLPLLKLIRRHAARSEASREAGPTTASRPPPQLPDALKPEIQVQSVATINHPSEATPYTRVTEYKHLTG
jgi:hypothetical protein